MSLVLIFWFLCIFRAEVERVRCGLLGDGVSGRANVISDKEFRDKNKVLTTSNQQKHGEANNVLFSVRPKTEWCLHLVESKFFFGYVHFSSISILFPWRVVDTRVFLLGHFAVHTEHGTKTNSTTENSSWIFRCNVAVWDTIARNSPLSDSKLSHNRSFAHPV